jgi:hypothetical protein
MSHGGADESGGTRPAQSVAVYGWFQFAVKRCLSIEEIGA